MYTSSYGVTITQIAFGRLLLGIVSMDDLDVLLVLRLSEIFSAFYNLQRSLYGFRKS